MKIKFFEKLTLQQKILSLVIGASVIVFIFAVGNISLKTKRDSVENGVKHINAVADSHVSDIKAILEKDLAVARTLSNAVQIHKDLPENTWKELFAKMYEQTLTNNPDILSIWDSWELNYIDPKYKKDYGRYECFFWRENGQIKHSTDIGSKDGDPADYARIKREKTESIEDPYFYSYTKDNRNQFLMTSIIVSNLVDGKFVGVIGLDIELTRYYDDIKRIRPFTNSYALLISNNIKYVAHPDKDKIGLNALDDYEKIFSKHEVVDKIKNGESAFFTDVDINGEESYFSVKPIIVGKNKMHWSLVTVVPKAAITKSSNYNFWESLIIGLVGISILIAITFLFSKKYIVEPIKRITQILKRISIGHVDLDMLSPEDQKDEMGQMFQYLNSNINGLFKKTEFAHNIGDGNLDTSLTLLSDEDLLGESLIHMQQSLKMAKDAEKVRKAEDDKRQWTNAGLAKFSEILRQNNDKLDVLSAEIIKNVVHYIEANQGGLFILNDDEPDNIHFELLSAYAYNRHKFIKKQILFGEGLVGTCALEKQTVFLKEIPESYIEITSGLGEARPRYLLIVPLLVEENVLGILELASFNEIHQHQIEFVEKLAQSVASTLISVRTGIRTSQLLAKTQQQSEEMSAQEEEMRQNMEELQATQEEAARKTTEMQNYIDAINNACYLIEYDPNGYIVYINDAYVNLLRIPREKLIGTHHSYKMEFDVEQQKEYDKFWFDLKNGIVKKVTNKFTIDDVAYTFDETYSPLMDEQGQVYKIVKIASNISK